MLSDIMRDDNGYGFFFPKTALGSQIHSKEQISLKQGHHIFPRSFHFYFLILFNFHTFNMKLLLGNDNSSS